MCVCLNTGSRSLTTTRARSERVVSQSGTQVLLWIMQHNSTDALKKRKRKIISVQIYVFVKLSTIVPRCSFVGSISVAFHEYYSSVYDIYECSRMADIIVFYSDNILLGFVHLRIFFFCIMTVLIGKTMIRGNIYMLLAFP